MNVFARVMNLLPAILQAVMMVEAMPSIQGSGNKKAAAVQLATTGLTIAEGAAGKDLLNHPAFTQVVGDAVDATVAVMNLTKPNAAAPATT